MDATNPGPSPESKPSTAYVVGIEYDPESGLVRRIAAPKELNKVKLMHLLLGAAMSVNTQPVKPVSPIVRALNMPNIGGRNGS